MGHRWQLSKATCALLNVFTGIAKTDSPGDGRFSVGRRLGSCRGARGLAEHAFECGLVEVAETLEAHATWADAAEGSRTQATQMTIWWDRASPRFLIARSYRVAASNRPPGAGDTAGLFRELCWLGRRLFPF